MKTFLLKNKYYLLFFFFCFSWFHFQYNHFENINIKITPKKNVDLSKIKLNLLWDSGYDYNSYEKKEIIFKDPQESFEIKLPPMKINKVRLENFSNNIFLNQIIEKFEVSTSQAQHLIDKFGPTNEFQIVDLPPSKKFSLFLLVFQFFLSLGTTIFIISIMDLFNRAGGVKKFFSGRHEKNFLLTTLFLFSIYLLWVLANWPVAMTNDSWSTLTDVKSLKFTNWHPYFYAFFILALLNFFDGLQLIAIIQAFSSSLILAYGIYYCSTQGIKWRYLLPFILFAGFSIPLGSYNTIFWKDVPFSLAILLFSILLFKYAIYKVKNKEKINLCFFEKIILVACSLGIIFFRHNGIIYLAIIPLVYFLFLNKNSRKSVLLSFFFFFFLFKAVLPEYLDISKPPGAPYQQMRLTLAIMTHPAFYSPTREDDIKIIEDATKHKWETIKSNYPEHWFWLWDNSEVGKNQWNSKGGQTENYNSNFLIKLIYNNFPIYLAEQTFGFFHSIGIDYNKSDKNNNYFENPLQIFGSNLAPPGKEFWGLVVHKRLPFPKLTLFLDKIFSWSMNYQGMICPLFFTWGLLWIFVLLFIVLIAETPLSAVALYVLFQMISATFVFFIGAGESWRYFYNIYLSIFLLLPFWVISKKAKIK